MIIGSNRVRLLVVLLVDQCRSSVMISKYDGKIHFYVPIGALVNSKDFYITRFSDQEDIRRS